MKRFYYKTFITKLVKLDGPLQILDEIDTVQKIAMVF